MSNKINRLPSGQMYMKLFHGRRYRDTVMEDWGEAGPVFGPLDFVHTTYGDNIKVRVSGGNVIMFDLHSDMLFYDGMFYGDWSVFVTTDGPSQYDRDILKRAVGNIDTEKISPKE